MSGEKKIVVPDEQRGIVTDVATQVVSNVTAVGLAAGAKHLYDKAKNSDKKK